MFEHAGLRLDLSGFPVLVEDHRPPAGVEAAWQGWVDETAVRVELRVFDRAALGIDEPRLLAASAAIGGAGGAGSTGEIELVPARAGELGYVAVRRFAGSDRERWVVVGTLTGLGYTIELVSAPPPGAAVRARLDRWCREGIEWRGSVLDPAWSDRELAELWNREVVDRPRGSVGRGERYVVAAEGRDADRTVERLERLRAALAPQPAPRWPPSPRLLPAIVVRDRDHARPALDSTGCALTSAGVLVLDRRGARNPDRRVVAAQILHHGFAATAASGWLAEGWIELAVGGAAGEPPAVTAADLEELWAPASSPDSRGRGGSDRRVRAAALVGVLAERPDAFLRLCVELGRSPPVAARVEAALARHFALDREALLAALAARR